MQHHSLDSIIDTDYGTINKNGTYDVDDFCEFEFKNGNTTWILIANWKDNIADDVYISFDDVKFPLGLCPEEAYQAMIKEALERFDDQEFWNRQFLQDVWIHTKIK